MIITNIFKRSKLSQVFFFNGRKFDKLCTGQYPRRAINCYHKPRIYLIIPAINIHWEQRGTISRKLELDREEGLDDTPYLKFLCGSAWILTHWENFNCCGCWQKIAEQLLQNDSQTKPKENCQRHWICRPPQKEKENGDNAVKSEKHKANWKVWWIRFRDFWLFCLVFRFWCLFFFWLGKWTFLYTTIYLFSEKSKGVTRGFCTGYRTLLSCYKYLNYLIAEIECLKSKEISSTS